MQLHVQKQYLEWTYKIPYKLHAQKSMKQRFHAKSSMLAKNYQNFLKFWKIYGIKNR